MTEAEQERQHQQDLAAIEELHRRDKEASLARDAQALLALWSEDPAALPPDGPILRGRETLADQLLGSIEAAAEAWEVLEYEQDFQEVEIAGDYAWDWGTFSGRSRHRETGREVSSSGKLLRILKRAPDGSWRVHRSIWNMDSPPPAEESAGGGGEDAA